MLMVAEVALAVMLVVSGGQLLGSFVKLINTDPGFRTSRILASVILPAPERYPKPEQRALFFKRILDAVRTLPGVESAGAVDALPLVERITGDSSATVRPYLEHSKFS